MPDSTAVAHSGRCKPSSVFQPEVFRLRFREPESLGKEIRTRYLLPESLGKEIRTRFLMPELSGVKIRVGEGISDPSGGQIRRVICSSVSICPSGRSTRPLT